MIAWRRLGTTRLLPALAGAGALVAGLLITPTAAQAAPAAVLASSAVALAPAAEPPAAGDPPPSWTFGCTGAPQSFTVPEGVSFLGVDADGGRGGSRAVDEGGLGGPAGRVTATIPVTPQQVLTISVGCAAQSRTPGWGFGTGGEGGGSSPGGFDGAGGGGSSAVVTTGSNAVVLIGAGGGGGGGGNFQVGVVTDCEFQCNRSAGGNGGAGGAPAQVGGLQRCPPDGAVCPTGPPVGCVDCSGGPNGARGGDAVVLTERGGGGGGGGAGFQGGGGGSGTTTFPTSGAGGGGGTSAADPSATDVTYAVSGLPGDGQVTLTAGDVQTTVVGCAGGTPQALAVPAGVTQISVDAYGAQGVSPGDAPDGFASGTGGLGAHVAGTFPVTPGEVLSVLAGCQGGTDAAYGAAGDRGDAEGGDAKDGGAGGAASSVSRTQPQNVPLLVAGGGGGGGGGGFSGEGGDGGATVGGQGPQPGEAGSAAGHGDGGCGGCAPDSNGTDGSGSNVFEDAGGGGGGGGGYVGGGGGHGGSAGGGGGGGGGAGSSYIDASHGDGSFVEGGDQPGNGSVTITWSLGPVLPVDVTASAGPGVLSGVPVTYTATITPPAGAPACTGCSVAFSYAIPGGPSGQLGTAAVGADWTAVSAPATLPPGAATVTAAFSGPGYQDSSRTYTQVTAGFSLATNPSPIPYDTAFDVVATPVPGQPDPTFVLIKDAGGAGQCVLGDGTCNGLRLPGSTAGTVTWTAVRISDGVSFTFPVTFVEQTPTVTFTAPPTVLAGEPFQVAAKVAPAGGTSIPTGLVTLVVDGANFPAIPLDATGAATFTDVKLVVGTHTLQVAYLGEPGRWAATTSATAAVDALDPHVSIALTASNNPAEVDTPVTYTATVTVPPDAPPCPACTVEFDFGSQGRVVVPVGPDTGWKAVAEFTWKTSGSFDVVAFLNQPARLAKITQTVVAGYTADIAMSTNPSPVPYDTPSSISAAVTGTPAGGPVPTGTVIVSDPTGAQVCTIELGPPASGCGFVAPSLNPAGTETWTAAYSGDATYPPRSVTFPVTRVAAPTSTTIISLAPPSPVPAGQSITGEAQVDGGTTTPVTGNGQLYIDGVAVGQPLPLNADGTFFLEFAIQEAGTHTVEARYLGIPGVWAPSAASAQVQITAGAPPPDSAIADLVAAAKAASEKLGRAAEQVQARYQAGAIGGACGAARALLAQISAEQKQGAITADQAEDLTARTTAVRTALGCT